MFEELRHVVDNSAGNIENSQNPPLMCVSILLNFSICSASKFEAYVALYLNTIFESSKPSTVDQVAIRSSPQALYSICFLWSNE